MKFPKLGYVPNWWEIFLLLTSLKIMSGVYIWWLISLDWVTNNHCLCGCEVLQGCVLGCSHHITGHLIIFVQQITIQADILPYKISSHWFSSSTIEVCEYGEMQWKAEFPSLDINISYPIGPVLNTMLHPKSISVILEFLYTAAVDSGF